MVSMIAPIIRILALTTRVELQVCWYEGKDGIGYRPLCPGFLCIPGYWQPLQFAALLFAAFRATV